VPAAIHVSPEAAMGGNLSKVKNGDIIRLDSEEGTLSCLISEDEMILRGAEALAEGPQNLGRNLYSPLRGQMSTSMEGASIFNFNHHS
jgi:phosphogluconate dehydratase